RLIASSNTAEPRRLSSICARRRRLADSAPNSSNNFVRDAETSSYLSNGAVEASSVRVIITISEAQSGDASFPAIVKLETKIRPPRPTATPTGRTLFEQE